MKKIIMILTIFLTGLFYSGVGHANLPCKDRYGNVVACKKSTSAHDTKAEKGTKKAGQGAKHAGYDVTHNKATKKMDLNKGNQKYKYQDDVK